MQLDNNKVVEALRSVSDPTTGMDIIRQKRVRNLKIEGHQVSFELDVAGVNAEVKMQLHMGCISAIQQVYPDAQVHVHMTQDLSGSKQRSILPQVKNIIAVASGKGGVGKSTVSVNLALGIKATGARVGLIDADLYGPSIPTMLNLRGQRPKVTEHYGKPKIIPLNAYGLPVMSIGFIVEPEQAVVLRGPRLAGIIKQFFQECMWPELDYLIIDLPPGTGDIQLTLVQTVPVTGAVIVTTPQEVSIADALKALNMFRISNIAVPILGVVENMSWFTPAELPGNRYFIFGEGGGEKLAKQGNTVLLGQIPLVQGIRESGDAGSPIILNGDSPAQSYFKNVSENLVREVDKRNDSIDPTRVVEVSQ